MNKDILVSVICNTYNHAPYIRDALDSFIMQKTDFPFEVLVHDDASTDDTPSIIRKYQEKYPDIIKPIYQTENQHSKHVSISRTFQYTRVKGRYIAVCEGDDYWIDPMKLQKQVDVLEKHPESDMCACSAIRVDALSKKRLKDIAPYSDFHIASISEVIMGEGGFFATSSLMYRKQLNDTIPAFRKALGLDYTLQIHGAMRGGVLYIPDYMAAYRWMTPNSWTERQKKSVESQEKFLVRKNNMLDILDKETNYQYSDIISIRKNLNQFFFFYNNKKYKDAFSHQCSIAHKYFGPISLGKKLLKAVFPRLSKFVVKRMNL